MNIPRWLTAVGVAAGLALGGGAVMAAAGGLSDDSSPSSSRSSASPSDSASPSSSLSPSPSASTSSLPAIPAEATITQDDALAIAAGVLGNVSTLREVELKVEDGRLIWEVELADDSEVEIDASSGVVVKVETGDDRDRGDDNSGPGSGDDSSGHGGDSGRGGHDDAPGDDHGSNSGRDGADD